MSKKRWVNNLLLWLLFTVLGAIVMSILVDFGGLLSESPILYYLRCLFTSANAPACWLVGCGAAIIITALLDTQTHTLDIALKPAGNGQFGTARFATPKERQEVYRYTPYWKADVPGFMLEYNRRGGEVDSSDRSVMIVSPPGGGKTTGVLIPTLLYNGIVNRNTKGGGASILALDSKGDEYEATHLQMQKDGYRTPLLDFRNPLRSSHMNLLHSVNRYMDIAIDPNRTEQERLRARARAERHAKILGESVYAMTNVATSGGENSSYFAETSKGLIEGMTLIVSEFGAPGERHIVSVFRLIIELNGLLEDEEDEKNKEKGSKKKTSTVQKNRLQELLKLLPGDLRARLYTGAATGADVRTSMNVFSSALSQLLLLLDAEVEQMICDQDDGFEAEELMEQPTCLYIVIPDEDSTTHFFAALLIMQLGETLVKHASTFPGGRLPRPLFILWDEFGQAPRCKDANKWFNTWRSRRIRFLIALQSEGQLELVYGRERAKAIREAIQIRMYTYLSTGNMAQALSKEMDTYTISTGSATSSSRRDSDSSSRSLTGRALMTPGEIGTMPKGHWLVLINGLHPIKAILQSYDRVFRRLEKCGNNAPEKPIRQIEYLTEAKLRERYVDKPIEPYPGMFDEPLEDMPDLLPPEEIPQRGFRRKKERSVTPDVQEQSGDISSP